MFYNIINRHASDYLCNLIPPNIQSMTTYPLRNGDDIILPFCRLSLTKDSFIPATIKNWSGLDPSIRQSKSLGQFKMEMKKQLITKISWNISHTDQENLI